jgi:very-short-patch-repair endonuclease
MTRRYYSPRRRSVGPPKPSPLEQTFIDAVRRLRPPELAGLTREWWVDDYRVDFALPAKALGIELDSRRWHSDPAAVERDRRRQAELESAGLRIVRLRGDEVFHNPDAAVTHVAQIAGEHVGSPIPNWPLGELLGEVVWCELTKTREHEPMIRVRLQLLAPDGTKCGRHRTYYLTFTPDNPIKLLRFIEALRVFHVDIADHLRATVGTNDLLESVMTALKGRRVIMVIRWSIERETEIHRIYHAPASAVTVPVRIEDDEVVIYTITPDEEYGFDDVVQIE